MEVSALNGQKMAYESKVIKVQNYTKSVIFRKKLLLFLPFYVMRYEEELETFPPYFTWFLRFFFRPSSPATRTVSVLRKSLRIRGSWAFFLVKRYDIFG